MANIHSNDSSSPSPKGPMVIYLDTCALRKEEYSDILKTVGYRVKNKVGEITHSDV